MFAQIAYYQILGLSFNLWLGIISLLAFLITGLVPFLNKKGIKTIPFPWHSKMAKIAIVVGLIHGFLGLINYL